VQAYRLKQRYLAVYEDELQRVWPINEENRKTKIEQFANANGFRLVYYKPGLCAIFEEQIAPTKNHQQPAAKLR
jgi:hypothetical protein